MHWSLHNVKEKNSKNVKSLIYKDYTLVETDDGNKSYVSPEAKTCLQIQGKIKALETAKNSTIEENQRTTYQRESTRSDSNSDSGYEVPVNPECNIKFEAITKNTAQRRFFRKWSHRFSETEMHPEDNGKINLPFYMAPLETELRAQKNVKIGKKQKETNDGDVDSEKSCKSEQEFPWNNFGESNIETSLPFPIAKSSQKKTLLSVSTVEFCKRTGKKLKVDKKQIAETQIKELKIPIVESKTRKTRFSLPWPNEDEVFLKSEKETSKESSEPEIQGSKYFFSKPQELLRGQWITKTNKTALNDGRDENDNDRIETEMKNEQVMKGEMGNDVVADLLTVSAGARNLFFNHGRMSNIIDFVDGKMTDNLQEPLEIFPEKEVTETLFKKSSTTPNENEEVEQSNGNEVSDRQNSATKIVYDPEMLRKLKNLPSPHKRRLRNLKKIDKNPLKKMFGIKAGVKGTGKREGKEIDSEIKQNEVNNDGCEEPLKFHSVVGQKRYGEPAENRYQSSIVPETHLRPKKAKKYNGNAETSNVPLRLTHRSGVISLTGQVRHDRRFSEGTANVSDGSDTESADHGSTDKSSMSKLTNEKQPKKLMNGLFGSFRKGKGKNLSGEVDFGKTSFPFEVTVKEQQSEVEVDGTKPDGIVYAELDMARTAPGNVMRRDDEKTEYAEIIYPTGKVLIEGAIDEFRKSKENLVSSRENLAELQEEALTTTLTPDGKKEAAV